MKISTQNHYLRFTCVTKPKVIFLSNQEIEEKTRKFKMQKLEIEARIHAYKKLVKVGVSRNLLTITSENKINKNIKTLLIKLFSN